MEVREQIIDDKLLNNVDSPENNKVNHKEENIRMYRICYFIIIIIAIPYYYHFSRVFLSFAIISLSSR